MAAASLLKTFDCIAWWDHDIVLRLSIFMSLLLILSFYILSYFLSKIYEPVVSHHSGTP